MKKFLLNFCLAASISLNASAGFAETIGTGHALGRQSLTEVRISLGLGGILSGVLSRTGLPESARDEIQISSWASPISQGADELLSTDNRESGSIFGTYVILGSGGKPERRLKVPEALPVFMVGTGLLGMIVLYKATSLRDRIRIRGAYSDVQTPHR